MSANILDKKIELIQWVSALENESIIEKLLKIRQQENKDWWNSVSAIEQESIEKGIADADKGKLKTHVEVRKVYEKWL